MKRLLPILLLVFSVGVGAETISWGSDGTYTGDVVGGVFAVGHDPVILQI